MKVKSKRLGLAALVTSAAITAAVVVAGPANAAEVAPPASTPVVATSAPGPSNPTTNGPASSDVAAQPRSVAGQINFVCVSTSGATYAVLYGQDVATQCNGAAAVQLWYDSGQFIKTVQLTPSAVVGHGPSSSTGCIIVYAGSALLFIQPDLGVVWYLSSAVAGAGLADCIAGG